MNAYQRLWWEQTQSDHMILILLRHANASACHELHYLQMVTEKLGKAYFWRSKAPPRKSHASFVRFLQALDVRDTADRARIASLLGFQRGADFQKWIPTITPLAFDLERLAPSLAGDNGPNPEYPWPREKPQFVPVSFDFRVWRDLQTGRGRQLLRVIDAAVREFPKYA
jgi:hypothetical protein